MNKEMFVQKLNELDIIITEHQLTQLRKYYELLVEWNKVMNLTGITEENEVYLKHFYDSLTISKVINLKEISSLADVGTGAGFPGMVIKILFPQIKVVLIDSLQKRINFLNEVINQLELDGIEAIHCRIEEYAIKNREKYDVVVARAVAQLNILLEYCVPIVKLDGYFIAMKANTKEEIDNASNALNLLSCEIKHIERFELPIEDSQRTIIKIGKNKKTNKKYPRKYSEIKKNPL